MDEWIEEWIDVLIHDEASTEKRYWWNLDDA